MKTPRLRHIPQRTCVACQQESAKRELIRVVRTPAGQVEVDPTGKKAGRGAYICRNKACWELAFKKKSLEHSLQTQLTPDDKAALVESILSTAEQKGG
jgi:predicted RNA-binding protein YlxR (DUF448 family)